MTDFVMKYGWVILLAGFLAAMKATEIIIGALALSGRLAKSLYRFARGRLTQQGEIL